MGDRAPISCWDFGGAGGGDGMDKFPAEHSGTAAVGLGFGKALDCEDVIGDARDRLRRQLRLRLAVLVDAIGCLQGGGGPRRDAAMVRREAVRWFRSRDRHPFSFPSVCEALGLDPVQTRMKILAGVALPECGRAPRGQVVDMVRGTKGAGKGRIYLRAAWAQGPSSKIGSRGYAA